MPNQLNYTGQDRQFPNGSCQEASHHFYVNLPLGEFVPLQHRSWFLLEQVIPKSKMKVVMSFMIRLAIFASILLTDAFSVGGGLHKGMNSSCWTSLEAILESSDTVLTVWTSREILCLGSMLYSSLYLGVYHQAIPYKWGASEKRNNLFVIPMQVFLNFSIVHINNNIYYLNIKHKNHIK